MHLCDYHYADVVLTLAYASVYFRSAFTAIGQKMSDYEAAHVCVLLIYLAHSFLLDETCPLRVWQQHIFKKYCNLKVLDAALFRIFKMRGFRLRITEAEEKQALSVLLLRTNGLHDANGASRRSSSSSKGVQDHVNVDIINCKSEDKQAPAKAADGRPVESERTGPRLLAEPSMANLAVPDVSQKQRPSRGATAGQSGWVGIRAPAQRAPRVARGDDAVVIPTVIATIAGLAVGVAFAKAVEVAGTASQERGTLSEGLKAQLSADAGMEDVEDDETTKQSELLESLKKAQGISEEEVKKLKKSKVEEDDGW
ncbi:unnamed protein product [Effrenium voratum]|uniref:Uncharacterized protein n=1 Tax=Effrenium voratum TaxID=2562239 RepID=A0AA36NIM5_9DINO|nr:unnamed protein product [Effrenium voratum]